MATTASSTFSSPASRSDIGRIAYAVAYVLVDQAQPDTLERLGDRTDLRQHVDAVRVVVDHPLEPADLTLDPPEAGEVLVFAE